MDKMERKCVTESGFAHQDCSERRERPVETSASLTNHQAEYRVLHAYYGHELPEYLVGSRTFPPTP